MNWLWLMPAVLVPGVAAAFLLSYRRLRLFGHHVHIERAQQLFLMQRERLQEQFSRAAAVAGMGEPYEFEQDVTFVRERRTGHILALVELRLGNTGAADGTTPVGTPRKGSGIFFLERGHWHTAGKMIPEMSPLEVLDRLQGQYEPVVQH